VWISAAASADRFPLAVVGPCGRHQSLPCGWFGGPRSAGLRAAKPSGALLVNALGPLPRSNRPDRLVNADAWEQRPAVSRQP